MVAAAQHHACIMLYVHILPISASFQNMHFVEMKFSPFLMPTEQQSSSKFLFSLQEFSEMISCLMNEEQLYSLLRKAK